jgi:WD40-like Beta Propeller Repeat
MVLARLLVVGLLGVSLSVSSQQSGGRPRSNLVVQAMHLKWPDGSPVESGGLNYPTDIYVVDTGGNHIRNLTHDAATNYLTGWLRDAGRILYESVPSDRMRAGRSGIFSIKPDGSARRQLASGKGELLPELSPDGHQILFAHGRWLYVMRSNGTDTRPLARFGSRGRPASAEQYYASWSPDGKWITFVRDFATHRAYSSHSALYVINADGTGLRRLTAIRPRVETTNPAWAPDGRRIAFDEYRYLPDQNRSYVMRADGTHVKRLKRLEGVGVEWFWLSNDRIAYRGGHGFQSIDVDGTGNPKALPNRVRVGQELRVASGPLQGSLPVSPDGRWIAFARALQSLSIAHLDGTHVRLVTRKVCCLVWSFRIEWASK